MLKAHNSILAVIVVLPVLCEWATGASLPQGNDLRTKPLEAKLRDLTAARPNVAKMLVAGQGGTSGVGWRWARLAETLHTKSAKIVVIGGSITAGNGLFSPEQKCVLHCPHHPRAAPS